MRARAGERMKRRGERMRLEEKGENLASGNIKRKGARDCAKRTESRKGEKEQGRRENWREVKRKRI